MTKIVITIQGGSITQIVANTDNVEMYIIDHDLETYEKSPYQPDSVMTDEGIAEFIEKETN